MCTSKSCRINYVGTPPKTPEILKHYSVMPTRLETVKNKASVYFHKFTYIEIMQFHYQNFMGRTKLVLGKNPSIF